ncbi:MAG: 16S rRNA (adenine(1518)-N(6)/adenine(1519)-N(6))-dimethyltransferase RsmA [Holosporales bacterium]|nr:16S rRNA (adenine(1518)-N(6)/adenine(1519)-N(6))-dimethyltransferase RsmA [Holosporales bacterium]
MTVTLAPLAEVVKTLQAKKTLGQHFLVHKDICQRIAMSAGPLVGKTVIEIGPGPGGLTRSLLEQGACVYAIEKDTRCVAALAPLKEAYSEHFSLYIQDVRRVDFARFSSPLVIANLPYNISTQLLFMWLPFLEKFDKLILMFQKEVAERLYAQPSTKAYGRLSVLLQAKAHVTPLLHLAPGAFLPPPKVHSTVVSIVPKKAAYPDLAVYTALETLTKRAFTTRRKMVKNTLSLSEQQLAHHGIAARARAENITVEQFLSLAAHVDTFVIA